jgi:PqqD family protein of HPr-rel-A system
MLRPADRYVPAASVHQDREDDVTVLTSARTGERHALSRTGAEVWALLQAQRHTVDRLVMALARRSSGQALAEVPDLVRQQLDELVERGLVERVAHA